MRDGTVGSLINGQTTTHFADDGHVVIPVHGVATFRLDPAPPVLQIVEAA
jgi:hypothetical protein